MEAFSIVIQSITAAAIIFAAGQLFFHGRQTHREFEHLYVARYWALMDRLSLAFAIEGQVCKEDKPVVRGYLQLCEDEIDLRRLGRITDNTWKYWSQASLDQASESAYTNELAELNESHYPLLRTLIGSGGADPLKRRWLWRKLHGL
jgi:hypothetical protein